MTITINNKTLELVEVPDDAYDIDVCGCLLFYNHAVGEKEYKVGVESLPTGSYRILCKASEATEEQAREIVEGMIYLGYRDYSYKKEIDSEDFELCFKYNFYTATESLSSLIRSLGMEVEKCIVLEKLK